MMDACVYKHLILIAMCMQLFCKKIIPSTSSKYNTIQTCALDLHLLCYERICYLLQPCILLSLYLQSQQDLVFIF